MVRFLFIIIFTTKKKKIINKWFIFLNNIKIKFRMILDKFSIHDFIKINLILIKIDNNFFYKIKI